jgi:hypothetical protein
MVVAEINLPLTLDKNLVRARSAGCRTRPAQREAPAMQLRATPTIDEGDLERALLRKSVDTLAGDAERCADCGRTPLIGETLYRFAAGATVCELCKPLRRAAPEGSERVRNSEAGQAVRVHRLNPA